jgi:hypothetical protein
VSAKGKYDITHVSDGYEVVVVIVTATATADRLQTGIEMVASIAVWPSYTLCN